jgi:hypothetical protein
VFLGTGPEGANGGSSNCKHNLNPSHAMILLSKAAGADIRDRWKAFKIAHGGPGSPADWTADTKQTWRADPEVARHVNSPCEIAYSAKKLVRLA